MLVICDKALYWRYIKYIYITLKEGGIDSLEM